MVQKGLRRYWMLIRYIGRRVKKGTLLKRLNKPEVLTSAAAESPMT